MLGIIRGLTDTFSMSEWNVVWLENNCKYHKKYFYYKTEARFFYDLLPFYHKRLERVR
ncbi:phage protein [Staphylococcus aureus]|nr:phage protein [Staphylococcus aureus]